MDNETIVVTTAEGEEKQFTILFTFENNEKSYVLYYDADEDIPTVFASIFDDEGHLFDVETAEEWDMINEVFESFMNQEEDAQNGEACGCGCGCGCGCDHDHEDGECNCGCDHDHEDGECGCGCDHDHEHHHEDGECDCGHHH